MSFEYYTSHSCINPKATVSLSSSAISGRSDTICNFQNVAFLYVELTQNVAL